MHCRASTTARWLLLAASIAWLAACAAESQDSASAPDRDAGAAARALGPDLERFIAEASILELQAAMAAGRLSAETLTAYFLAQIAERNPELGAVIAVNPGALAAARALDAERARGALRGPLHGIPILVKDNIETRELPTTAGSLALASNRTGRDAPVVARVRAAGAIVLGKANLSEWANFRSERSSSGWSAVGGQGRNPHDTTRSPCGSSSGSGIAVAAGLAVAALGTETDGSVVCPSSVNGVVGIRPSMGFVSRTGIVPISHTQDSAGPMARSVADAAILLAAMAGPDPQDPVTEQAGALFELGDAGALGAAGLRARRIGVLRSAVGYREGVERLLRRAIAALQASGAVIVDGLELTPYDTFYDDSYEVLLYEFKHDLDAYLAGLPNDSNQLTLEELIRFNEEHAAAELAYFGQDIFLKAQAKGPLTEEAYTGALARIRQATRSDGIDRLLREHRLDALIAPTYDPAWVIDLVNGDHWGVDGFSTYPAVAGYPHVTLPMGKVHGLPVGLSFTGAAFSDRALLELAAAFERLGVGRAD
ncbi:MAG TPA: amidase [Myxococcota bacterium]